MRKISFIIIESPITFDERFIVTWVPFFIPDFNLLICELHVILYHFISKQNKFTNTFTVPCEKSKIVSFVSSIMKNIVVFPSRSEFPVKLICWFAFGSASSSYCLLKSIAVIL